MPSEYILSKQPPKHAEIEVEKINKDLLSSVQKESRLSSKSDHSIQQQQQQQQSGEACLPKTNQDHEISTSTSLDSGEIEVFSFSPCFCLTFSDGVKEECILEKSCLCF